MNREWLFCLIAIPYLLLWWAAVRILFGRKLLGFEWIPIVVFAVALPSVLIGLLYREPAALAVLFGWGAVPLLVIVPNLIRRWSRRTTTAPEYAKAANERNAPP